MASNIDVTLLGFTAVDLRNINVGDVVVFRSTSIAHRPNLVLRHGRTARVTGFGRNRTGQQQVEVTFLADQRFDKEQDVAGKLTKPIGLAASNLVASDDKSLAAGKAAHAVVENIISSCAERRRPWLADIKVKDLLGDAGMYDRMGQPAQQLELEDMPF